MMDIDVIYQNRCSLAISLKFEYALRKIPSHKYIDTLILKIVHKSCKESMCKKSCLETNFSFKYGCFSDWVVFFETPCILSPGILKKYILQGPSKTTSAAGGRGGRRLTKSETDCRGVQTARDVTISIRFNSFGIGHILYFRLLQKIRTVKIPCSYHQFSLLIISYANGDKGGKDSKILNFATTSFLDVPVRNGVTGAMPSTAEKLTNQEGSCKVAYKSPT